MEGPRLPERRRRPHAVAGRRLILILFLALAPAAGQEPARLLPVPVFKEGKWGLADRKGKVLVEPAFSAIGPFSEGLAPIQRDGKWGYIDRQGLLVVEPAYDEVLAFTEKRGGVRAGNRWGYVDRHGHPVGPLRFEDACPFSEGRAAVRIGHQWGYVDPDLRLTIVPRFEEAWDYTEGLAPVRIENRWGYVDRDGKPVIDPEYHWVDNFSEGLAHVEGGKGRSGYINRDGKFVIRRRFWGANPFSSGLAAVQPEVCGLWGLMDRSGQLRLAPRYEKIGLFSEGLAPARSQFKWGYLDPTGKLVIPTRFSAAEPFVEGIARVRLDGKVGFIDRQGAFVAGPYDLRAAAAAANDAAKPPPEAPAGPPTATSEKIEGKEPAEPRKVSLIGNPYRERYPDDSQDVFSRNIRDMILYRGRIYVGGGDYWNNTGPIDIFSFAPGRRSFKREYTVPEEMVAAFYVFGGRLVVPGNDPRESWEFGNIYLKEGGRWRKRRTIPHGLHVFKLACVDRHLFALVSTENGAKLVASRDWGKSWAPVPSYGIPSVLVASEDTLHGLDAEDTLFALESGMLTARPMVPRRRQLLDLTPTRTPRRKRHDRALPFAGGWFLLPPFGGVHPTATPHPPHFLEKPGTAPRALTVLADRWIADAVVRDNRLHLLCTRAEGQGYRNTIVVTEDAVTWRTAVTFFTPTTYARSFEEADGRYYVSLGSNGPRRKGLPRETGDLLEVVPAAR